MSKFDLYEHVTNQIIESLESGTTPWQKPWNSDGFHHPLPINFSSKKAYRGINIPLLWHAEIKNGYKTDAWVTYKQAKDLGGQVKEGEKSTMVVFWNFLEKESVDDPTKVKKIPFLKYYNVFNLDQVSGVELPELTPYEPNSIEALVNVDQLVLDHKVDLRIGGDHAYCSRATGHIQMPESEKFKSQADYYATLLHELTHWSGHPNRLDRTFGERFGDQAYAFEELVAEMGSAFLCADLGVQGKVQHDSYIASWLKVLKSDKKAIFTASSKAQQAHQFLVNLEDSQTLKEVA